MPGCDPSSGPATAWWPSPNPTGVFAHLSCGTISPCSPEAAPLDSGVRGVPDPARARHASRGHPVRRRAANALAQPRARDDARCVVIDEPSLGLAPALTDELYEVVARIAAGGVTVVLADQYEDRVQRLAAVVYRLERGRSPSPASPSCQTCRLYAPTPCRTDNALSRLSRAGRRSACRHARRRRRHVALRQPRSG